MVTHRFTHVLVVAVLASSLAAAPAGTTASAAPPAAHRPAPGSDRPTAPPSPKGPPASDPSDPGLRPRSAGTADAAQLTVRPGVATSPCADDPSWLCGSVRVPVDRARPAGRAISIAFTILPHEGSGPGLPDPVLATAGGPGSAATADRYYFEYVARTLLEDRDLVLIDNRGTGGSAAIDCPALQDGVRGHGDFVDSVGACGRQLGDDADRYGTGDVAMDIEAVRQALGYLRVNYYAPSYASVAAQAYAVRYPSRVRSVVIDAGMPVTDAEHRWTWGQPVPGALRRHVALSCRRAPACAEEQPDAGHALAALVHRVGRHPVTGTARDQDGNRRRVRVGEVEAGAIAWLGHWLNSGEVAAAQDALRAGDTRPLLRLAAESPVWPGASGDPGAFSFGDNAAAFCNDADFVWERSDPVPVRRATYRAALEALPRAFFAPFSPRAWTTLYVADYCLRWPAPDRFVPAVPPGATVTGVPVLLIVGDLDTTVPTETTEALRAVFPDARSVTVEGAGHTATGWSSCAHDIVGRFLATTRTGDTTCARKPSVVEAAVARFFRTSAGAPMASPLAGDRSTRRDREVVTSAVRAVQDAWLRSARQSGAVAVGPGLRGGRFRADYASFPDRALVRLHRARFARDVGVSGRSVRTYADNRTTMRVRVAGPGRRDGVLHAHGRFGQRAPFATFDVTGRLGHRPVHVEVPAN